MARLTLFLLSVVFIATISSCSSKKQNTFAVVVDEQSYKEAEAQIKAYAKSVERQGLNTIVIVDKWQNPDSIRQELKNLYNSQKPLEGCVFIGDIPIPMLRDAQHLATAFKMDQEKFPWIRSSIPSDRFYDDFDLQFDYLKKDEKHPLYHYYSLKAESPQRLTVDIYSARIKPPEVENKYELLRKYLDKVVDFKSNPRKVDQLLFFTGHGYNSEDPRTWMDEKITLSQQFNYLESKKEYLEYINFHYDEHIKFRLLSELKRNDLDIALLHHHGGATAQYLDGTPESSSITGQIDNITYYLRSKIRSAKRRKQDVNEAKKYFKDQLGVSDKWFEGSFDKEKIKEDSIYNANLDIYVEDLENYSSSVPFVMLDACFTGSFHRDRYLSGEYLFDDGGTIAVQANSVNVFQDKWPDEMVGLLGLGMRIGLWHKMICTVETHLIGDPTLAFAQFDENLNVNNIATSNMTMRELETYLDSDYADVQALALHKMFDLKGIELSDFLLGKFKSSNYNSVRAEAFRLLESCNDANYVEVINLGLSDSYELLQRFAALHIAKSGDLSHIQYLISALLENNLPKRVAYNLRNALNVYEGTDLLKELDKQILEKEYLLDPEKKRQETGKIIEYASNRIQRYVDNVLNDNSREKDKYFSLRNFRNQNVHCYLDELISFIDTTKNEKLKLTGIEMLGWFNHSYKKDTIKAFCEKEYTDEDVSSICKNELIKTKNRIY